jgi:hypothetical protein
MKLSRNNVNETAMFQIDTEPDKSEWSLSARFFNVACYFSLKLTTGLTESVYIA